MSPTDKSSTSAVSAHQGVVIAGGAFAGLALALALRQSLGADFPVTVADPALGRRPSKDPRASAIVAAGRRLLTTLGVWDAISGQAQPILDMVVTDSKLDDAMRPAFLTFGGDVEPGEPFAHMVENRLLIDALHERALAAGVELRPNAVTGYEARADAVTVTFADGATREISVDLLQIGDTVIVKPNERLPADGFVVVGRTAVDQAPVT